MRPTLIIAAGFAVLPILTASAWAQANRTFVSGHGSDTNPCSLSAPCRSFAQAISVTNPGGEVSVLDTAGYGTLAIGKSISITNEDGVEAGITTSSATDAVSITVPATDTVNLRGLTIEGGGVGTNGITFNSNGTLNIQNCIVRGFTQSGLNLLPQTTGSVSVADTTVAGNGVNGVLIEPLGTGAYTMLFERVQALNNATNGFFLFPAPNSGGSLHVTIADSVVTGSSTAAFNVDANINQSATTLLLVNSKATYNSYGVLAENTNSTVILSQWVSYDNQHGFDAAFNSVIKSFGDNRILDTSNGGSLTPVALQ